MIPTRVNPVATEGKGSEKKEELPVFDKVFNWTKAKFNYLILQINGYLGICFFSGYQAPGLGSIFS